MIAFSYTYGQKVQENSIVVIGSDTFALVQIKDIRLSQNKHIQAKKYIEYSDSLTIEIERQQKEINERKMLSIQQTKRDSLQNVVYYLLKDKYNSLKKDYNKLKAPKLNGIIGGGLSASYYLDSKQFNNVAVNLNLGLIFKRKYITSFDIGIGLNRSLVFGLNGGLVF